MTAHPSHKTNMDALKRIEGQVRGIQRMIEEKRYCVDILTQITAVNASLNRVQDKILESHLNNCVKNAINGTSGLERQNKINEIFEILKKYRK